MNDDTQERCPKCATPKCGDSCPRCGLVFALFHPAVLDARVSDELKALWTNVEAGWGETARHALFVERALMAGEGGYAAACYRRKGNDPMAVEQLRRIATRLTQMLELSAAAPMDARSRAGRIITVVLLVLFVTLAAWMTFLVLRVTP